MLLKQTSSFLNQRGQSLLEVVMVAFVLVMALVALISLTTVSIARNRLAKERTVATRLAQEGLEWFKFERDRLGFDAILLKADVSAYCLATLPTVAQGGIESLPEGFCDAGARVNTTEFGSLFLRQITLVSSDADLNPGMDTVTATVLIEWRGQQLTLEGVVKQWER